MGQRLRLSGLVLCALTLLMACADPLDPLGVGRRYVQDADFRRRALEQSLEFPVRGYGELRLEQYATADGAGWEALPVWNPPVRPLMEADLGRFASDPYRPSTSDEGTLSQVLESEPVWTEEAILELGRRAFETYPVQLDTNLGAAAVDAEGARAAGLWIDSRHRVGGLVRVALPGGSERFAVTCATCHGRVDEEDDASPGLLRLGAVATELDMGAMSYWAAVERGTAHMEVAHLLDWGPGSVDVTPDGQHNAAAIPDLRSLSFHTHLHWSATLRNSLQALAIRIETLIITSNGASIRPPREVSFALAYYVWHLSDGGEAGDRNRFPQGALVFDQHCASCHRADGHTAEPIEATAIGTDPAVAQSLTRGTGRYRVPSLWGVAHRRQFFHNASVHTLERLLDPERLAESPGHAYGLDLSPPDREALLLFIRSIGEGI